MGYDVRDVRVFVESLRRHYEGPAALLITSRSPPPLLAYLRQRNIRPIFFDCTFWMVAHVQIGRFVRYGEFLRGCDVSDVIFQSHPFAGSPAGELVFFLEDARATIGACPSNSFWIQNVFGDEVLKRLSGKRISCSGTTMGSHQAILRYIETLLSYATPELTSRLIGTRGEDQGIHNYMLHTAALPNIRVSENGEFVYTLARVPPAETCVLPGGISVAASGRIPAIVHQYNYHRAALELATRMYPFPESIG
jgi:hypothetical protein